MVVWRKARIEGARIFEAMTVVEGAMTAEKTVGME